jgi:hypothetical protein
MAVVSKMLSRNKCRLKFFPLKYKEAGTNVRIYDVINDDRRKNTG